MKIWIIVNAFLCGLRFCICFVRGFESLFLKLAAFANEEFSIPNKILYEDVKGFDFLSISFKVAWVVNVKLFFHGLILL